MSYFKPFRLAACAALCLLGVYTTSAQAACDQISPNPNPVGSTIYNTSSNGCNELTPFDNYGVVYDGNPNTGVVGTLTNNGTLNNNTGGAITDSHGGTLNNSGTLNNDGSLYFAHGTLNNSGTLNNNAQLDSGTLTNNGMLNNNVGAQFTFWSYSTTNNAGATLNNSGTIAGQGYMSNLGTLNNNVGGKILNGSPDTVLGNSGVVNNAGLIGGIGGNSGVINNSGVLGTGCCAGGLSNEGLIENNSGGNINIYGHNGLTNGGTINNYSGSKVKIDAQANSITNGGQFSVFAGASVVGSTSSGYGLVFSQSAGTTRIDGTLTGREADINGGVLQGSGTINALVTIGGGTIAPGDSPGTMTINGNLTFNSGTLLTEIGASEFDLLHITGAATFLTGTFAFSFLDGYLPAYGSSWVFLTADGGVTGWQDLNVAASALDGGYSYFITSDGNNLMFTAAVPEPETYAMMFAGLGLLGLIGRRRKQKEAA